MRQSPDSLPRDDRRPTARSAVALAPLIVVLGVATAVAVGVVVLVAWIALGSALG